METSNGCGNGGVKQEYDLGTCHLTNWKKPLECKWVHTMKYRTDGTLNFKFTLFY